jgi:hypothetical protein
MPNAKATEENRTALVCFIGCKDWRKLGVRVFE